MLINESQAADFKDEVFALPVWDTHTHLDLQEDVRAGSFWDLGHYFWFWRELAASGYPEPAQAMALPETARAEAFAKAYQSSRNTAWHGAFQQTFRDLYGLELTGASSVLEADRRVQASSKQEGWAQSVIARLNIRKIVAANTATAGMRGLGDVAFPIPILDIKLDALERDILSAPDQAGKAEACAEALRSQIDALAAANLLDIRLEPALLEKEPYHYPLETPVLGKTGNRSEDIRLSLWLAALESLDKHGFTVQCFLGMARMPDDCPMCSSLNRPDRIYKLHPIFAKYKNVKFELVNAAELSALDLVQAARIYPNVYPGGLWWFSFRPSVFEANMRYRSEALPAGRCTLLASDARHIEWCHTKVLLVKNCLTRFLLARMRDDELDREAALFVAREWLHDSPARLHHPTT